MSMITVMRKNKGASRSDLLIWLGVLVAIGGLVAAQQWLLDVPTEPERVELKQTLDKPPPPPKPKPQARATMAPGRVVRLETAKGRMEFVLYEKDCPLTTGRIIDLVQKGCYDGLTFDRVEPDLLIQTAECRAPVTTIPLEIREGLVHTKGAVGMARRKDRDTATSVFYILMEPARHLDYDYAVFGRLITGMDVCFKIRRDDLIKRASLRNFTNADRERLNRSIQIQVERETQ